MPGSRERFLSVLKDTPPLEYLAFISPSRPTTAMQESIQRMQRNGLTDEAINVVNDYVMRKNGFRYSAPYAEKIADTLLKKRAFTAEEALDHFALIQKKQKKEEAKEAERPTITVEDLAEFLADVEYDIPPILLGPTDEQKEEIRKFSESLSEPIGKDEDKEIKAFLARWDREVKETAKARLEEKKKTFVKEFVNRNGGSEKNAFPG